MKWARALLPCTAQPCSRASGRQHKQHRCAGMLRVLTEALGSQDVRLRRRCVACLGELLFYIAAMPAEAAAVSCWHGAEDTLSAVMSLLRPGEDSIVQASAHAALLPRGPHSVKYHKAVHQGLPFLEHA